MGFLPYLAMTAAEFASCMSLPQQVAYMACHFSPYGTGLSGIPRELPDNAMLILNDRTPICGHDPGRIAEETAQAVRHLKCESVLLDFQRPGEPLSTAVAEQVVQRLSCPVAVSDLYAGSLDCPVFVSSPPLWVPLGAHLAPWQGREIWLEAALENATIRVRENGSIFEVFPFQDITDCFLDETIHCAYHTEVAPDEICFQLSRPLEQLLSLLEQADALGVKKAVGLFQQLSSIA